MCEPIGRWVKSACGSTTGEERKDVHDTLTGVVWWVIVERVVSG